MNTTLRALLLAAFANPKSTLAGVAILAITYAFLLGRVTLQEFLGAFAALTAGGLIVSKDGAE